MKVLEKLSGDNDIGVVIVTKRVRGGDTRVYQKSSLPYLDSADDEDE